mgnify:CR=1 FL=1
MNNLHFYNLRSRLGMINLPHRMDEFNTGVEEGGDAILSEEFLAKFRDVKLDSFTFPAPEDIERKKYFDAIVEHSNKAMMLMEDTLQDDEFQVVIGGDHSVAFCSLAVLLRRLHSHSIGYILIDSHPDINSIATSPTGNFHGMWMRPFIDTFENEEINQLIPHKLNPENILYIGNLDLDPEEAQVIEQKKIKTVSVEDLRLGSVQTLEAIQKFMDRCDHVHLDIDIDGFDRSIAPATGIPAKEGLLKKDIVPVLEMFAQKESRSLDLVEVNPQKDKAEKTVKLAQELILKAFPQ